MTVTATYDATLSRVRLAATSLDGSATYATIERSTNGIRWTTVRGGTARTVTGGAVSLDDYEFVDGVANTWRVTAYDSGDTETDQETVEFTPALDGVWLKSIPRPFLNRRIHIADISSVARPARGGVFDIVGRSDPVTVGDLRGSRRWTMTVRTDTLPQARTLDLILASGDDLFIHVPAGRDIPGGHVFVEDTGEDRFGPMSTRRMWPLPVIRHAEPAADIVGATVTCAGVLNAYATCADLLAAHATCADLLELVGDPEDVLVE